MLWMALWERHSLHCRFVSLSNMSMWRIAAGILVFVGGGGMILTEVLRSVIHSRRKSKDGLGGTQDIATWGTIICGELLIIAAVRLLLSFVLG